MRRKIVLGAMLLLIAALTLTFGIPVKAQKTKVVIGWAHPLTTAAAGPTAIHHAYYKMLIQDYNAKGGLNVPGVGLLPIEYIEYDNEFDIGKTLTLYEKLILEDQVDLLFGPWGTAFNTAVAPLTEKYQFPLVGLTVGSDSLSKAMMAGEYRWMFLTLGVPWEDGQNLAELFTYINENVAKEDQKIRKVGITYRSDEHGVEHATGISGKLAEIGIEVPVLEEYDAFSPPTDWTPIITKFIDAGVDVAMLCGYDEGAFFVHACITLDYNPKLLFIGPVMELSFLVFGPFGFTYGQMAGVTYYNGFPSTNYKSVPEYWAWAIEHEERLGYLPFPASLSFYCGLQCIFLAVEEHGLDRAAIRDALETETFNTKAGAYKFRVGRGPEIVNHGTISQWQGGELMEVVWPLDKKTANVIYPKFAWWWAEVPDANRDGIVNIKDVYSAARAFGTTAPPPRSPRWDPTVDLNRDGKVNIVDMYQIARNFGRKYS